MSGYVDFLKRFSAANIATVQAKPQQSSEDYYRIAAARQNGTGQSVTDPVEQDLMTLSTSEILSKYGPAGISMIQQRAMGDARYTRDRYDPTGNTLFDVASSAGKGLANSIGGLAALAIGAQNDTAGAYVSGKLGEFNDWIQSKQSSGLNAHRRANRVANEIEFKDNKARYEQERSRDGDFIAGLRRIGRDAMSAVGNAIDDPTILGDGLADAAGSLVAGGVVSKGARLLGSKAVSALLQRGVLSEGAALKAAQTGSKVAMPGTIGGMEAGGAYQQTVNQVMAMSHDELLAGSPEYAQLIQQGWNPDDARTEIATSAGLTAAAIQFPVAAATGTLVSKFEANPFRGAASGLGVVKNGASEMIEEAIQSGAGQLAGNAGVSAYANQGQDLLDGVGEQVGLGGLFGFGSAGVVQAPGAAVNTAVAGAKGVANAAVSAGKAAAQPFVDRLNTIKSERDAASPVSSENLKASSEQVLAEAPQVAEQIQQDIAEEKLTPEQGSAIKDKLDRLTQTIAFDPEELAQSDMSAEVRSVIGAATNRFDALDRAAQIATSTQLDPISRVQAAVFINDTLSRQEAQLRGDLVSAIEAVPDDHPALNKLRSFEDVLINFESNPQLVQARKIAQTYVEQLKPADLSEASIATPKGQQAAKTVASVAATNPELVSEDLANLVLEHARAGRISLSPTQAKVLSNSAVLSKTGNTYKLQAKKLELKPVDIVNKQILTEHFDEASANDRDSEVKSLAGHTRAVMSAYQGGDLTTAAERLRSMMLFAQHMQNKVEALNKAYETGADSDKNAVKYPSLLPNRKWAESLTGVFVRPTSLGSVKLAQTVNLEAKALADMANQLAQSMPELGVAPIQAVELNPDLVGPASKVVDKFRKGAQKAPTKLMELVEEPAKVEPAQAEPSTARTESTAPKTDTAPVEDAKTSTPQQEEAKPEEPAKTEKPVAEEKPVEGPEQSDAAQPQQDATQPETVEAAQDEAPAEPVAEESPKTLAEQFPGLVDRADGKVKNWFTRAFKFPKEARSRLLGERSPAIFVRKALSSQKAFVEALGGQSKHTLTADLAKAYAEYVAVGGQALTAMNERLQKFLDTPLNSKSDQTFRDAFLNGIDNENQVNGFPRGKGLNIVEQNEDESLGYNQKLIESSVLAGLQWMLTADERSRELDLEDVAKILGTSEAKAAQHVPWFNQGIWLLEGKRGLADAIVRYWGVQPNRNAPEGYVRGIAENIAAEVIRGLEAAKMLSEESRDIEGKTHRRLNFSDEAKALFGTLKNFPSAIEQVSLIQPEDVNYIGEAPTEVATNQLHGSPVPLSDQQRAAIKAAQKTPYKLNLNMLGFLEMLGDDGVVSLFGRGNPTSRGLNVNTAKSIKGYNQTVISAWQGLKSLVAEMDNIAETAGTKVEELPVFFRYGISSVGRMQMRGRANPQASKLVREVLLPTWSTLDLSSTTGQDYKAFMLAVAQHIGIKVHKLSADKAIEQAVNDLGSKYAGIVQRMQDWLASDGAQEWNQDEVDQVRSVLGDKVSVGAVHALMEYARYLQDLEGRKTFKTGLYLEADGVTDGPVNALMNLVGGQFTPEWLDLFNRGGMYLGKAKQALADYVGRNEDTSQDLYQKTTNFLYRELGKLSEKISRNSGVVGLNSQLVDLMLDLLPELTLNENKQIVFDRGIAKNPLTVTVYGSGVRGIADKLTAAIVEQLYERLSSGEQLSPRTWNALQALTTNQVQRNFGKYGVVRQETDTRTGQNEDFTLTPQMIENLETNVLELFARPLTGAVREIMGEALESASLVRKATQVQSIFFKYAYRRAIAEAVANKDGSDGTLSSDFLSKAELDGIFKDLLKQFPMINTGTQMIWVGGSAQADIKASEFGSDTNDKMKTEGFAFGPENAGVSGIPFLVISTGDGQMILNALTGEQAPQGVLPVFDGINMKLDSIEPDSVQINKAVYDGWMRNPLRSVQESFSKFVNQLDMNEVDQNLSDEMADELAEALVGPGQSMEMTASEYIAEISVDLSQAANELDARKAVLAKVNMSVDHMASAGAPFVKEDGIELPADPEQAVKQLNEMYAEELAKIAKPKEKQARREVSEDLTDFLGSIEDTHPSGAKVIGRDTLRGMLSKLNIPLDQRGLLRSAVNALASKDWTVVHGTPEQLLAYARENGIKLPMGFKDSNGLALPGDKTIFLVSANSETLTHEFIHAATIQLVAAYYADKASVSKDIAETMQRIEALMDDFLKVDPASINDPAVRSEFLFAKSQIENARENPALGSALQMTAAVSEFMAWTLANQKLSDLARKTKVRNPLAIIAAKVLERLKKLWRQSGLAPTPRDDIYSNLRFNTLLLMEGRTKKVTAPENIGRVALFQARNYGSSDRLTQLEQTLIQKLVVALPQDPVERVRVSDKYASMYRMAAQVRKTFQAARFDMSMQESSLFETLVTTAAIDKGLNGNALSRVEELFRHVLNKLTVEDFMADPNSQDPNDRYWAQKKFDTIVGNYFVGKDLSSRSMMMPAFLALSMVNEEFRNILANMDLPSSAKSSDGTLDAILSNAGAESMDRLAKGLSGEGKASDVLDAIEMLTRKIADVQTDREAFIEQHVDTVGNGIDKANNWIVEQLQRLSELGAEKFNDVGANSSNRFVQLATRAGEAALGIMNQEVAEKQSRGTISLLNKANVWKPIHDLFNEVIGRTSENAPIYDMIKAVRAYIQQLRQIYRERLPAIIQEKFSRKLTQAEWSSLYHTMAKTDLAALHSLGSKRVLRVLGDAKILKQEISRLENEVDKLDAAHQASLLRKSRELAEFMVKGKAGANLLRNAEAVASLFGELPPRIRKSRGKPSGQLVQAIDQLTSLYALDLTPASHRIELGRLVASESQGLEFVFSYLVGQRNNELDKTFTDRARINHYKGHVPTETKSGASLIIASDRDYADLVARGYSRVAPYKGSNAERGLPSMGYYFAPLSGKSPFNQGIAQNIRQVFNGVDPVTGFSAEMLGAGRITDQTSVARILAARGQNRNQVEALLPIYDADGDVIAFERGMDPAQLQLLERETDLSKVLGIWRGRQVEEASAEQFNRLLVNRLQKIWENREVGREDEFVDLFDPKSHKDPVVTDAVKLLTPAMRRHIENAFGKQGFMVRKDMINDVVGYRSASVGDLWTGVTRLPPETAKVAANVLTAVMGKDAYKYLVTGEKLWQNFVSDARTTIVVRSVVVPASNIISNVYQLASRGVPLKDILRGMPKKLAEIHAYHENHQKEIRLEAELLAVKNNPTKSKAIKAQLKSLQDGHRRLSIWPLIAAGEFSSVSEATVMREESTLFEGKLTQYMESMVNKLPDSVRTAGRYAIISRDTALFQGLQRAVEYGDFLAKAVLYDELTKRKGMESRAALAQVGEEFVNYDRLPGRFRGSLENMGLLWFWHFKLRAMKVAMSTIRNNPLHLLLTSLAPTPEFFGSVGLPVTDNALAVAAEGKLHYSVGPLQGLHAHALNPWANLLL